MKVCTDSCLFGAWIYEPKATEILDIGTGTGLLTLMIAQRHQAQIDAVEIDKAAFHQATENIRDSSWANKIRIYNADINDFSPQKKYDLIISNPPFFSNHLKSPDCRKNAVHHDEVLTLPNLITCLKRLLVENGKFYVMLPPEESRHFERLAAEINLYCFKKVLVRENEVKKVFRIFSAFQFCSPPDIQVKELIIKDTNQAYTSQFSLILKDFYLIL